MLPEHGKFFEASIGKNTLKAGICFLVMLSLCMILTIITIRYRGNLERLSMEQLITEKSIAATEVITKLLYKTQALAALVIQNNGQIENFEMVAATIIDDPAIINVLLAPKDVVSHVYPLPGNEAVLGYDLFGKGAGNKEAILARDMNQLVFGGPFEMVQGGMALVGRLPVWLKATDRGPIFWGIVSVTLAYPQALAGAALDNLAREGLAYEIWRINPDDGKRQIIANSPYAYNRDAPYIEKRIRILNADWRFRIMPIRAWYEHPGSWLLVAASLCISGLVALLAKNNEDLKQIKGVLEKMVLTDQLTGLANREGLEKVVQEYINKKEPFKLYRMNLDHFSKLTNHYGSAAGGQILKAAGQVIKRRMNPSWTLACIHWDAFIMVCPLSLMPPSLEEVFWNSVGRAFKEPLRTDDGQEFALSLKHGFAVFPDDGTTLEELLSYVEITMGGHGNGGNSQLSPTVH